MIGNYLFDTNAVINLLKGDQSLLETAENAQTVYISIITVVEFVSFRNITESDKKLFEEFCERIEVIDLIYKHQSLISEIVKLRKKYLLKTPDAIICASALLFDAMLVTADQQLISVWEKLNHE